MTNHKQNDAQKIDAILAAEIDAAKAQAETPQPEPQVAEGKLDWSPREVDVGEWAMFDVGSVLYDPPIMEHMNELMTKIERVWYADAEEWLIAVELNNINGRMSFMPSYPLPETFQMLLDFGFLIQSDGHTVILSMDGAYALGYLTGKMRMQFEINAMMRAKAGRSPRQHVTRMADDPITPWTDPAVKHVSHAPVDIDIDAPPAEHKDIVFDRIVEQMRKEFDGIYAQGDVRVLGAEFGLMVAKRTPNGKWQYPPGYKEAVGEYLHLEVDDDDGDAEAFVNEVTDIILSREDITLDEVIASINALAGQGGLDAMPEHIRNEIASLYYTIKGSPTTPND